MILKAARHMKISLIIKILIPCAIALAIMVIWQAKPDSQDKISSEKPHAYHIIPEYERHLDKVLISLATNSTGLEVQESILEALPEYTQIDVIVPDDSEEMVREYIKNKPYRDKVKIFRFNSHLFNRKEVYMLTTDSEKLLHPEHVKEELPVGTYWSQDLFESAVDDKGRIHLLVPEVYKEYLQKSDGSKKVVSDNWFIRELVEDGFLLEYAPVTFRGGNIMYDVIDGRTIAFAGKDALVLTHLVGSTIKGHDPDDEEIRSRLKDLLEVDELVIVGKAHHQPSHMFHMDQSMLLLDHGLAAVTKIIMKDGLNPEELSHVEDAEVFLSDLREKLVSHGYRVVDIETTAQNVLHYQFHANSIPFIDSRTGQKKILMPLYVNDKSPEAVTITKHNMDLFRSLGFEVSQVRSTFDAFKGGPHCLVNVIS